LLSRFQDGNASAAAALISAAEVQTIRDAAMQEKTPSGAVAKNTGESSSASDARAPSASNTSDAEAESSDSVGASAGGEAAGSGAGAAAAAASGSTNRQLNAVAEALDALDEQLAGLGGLEDLEGLL
jgi:hypothetical protein